MQFPQWHELIEKVNQFEKYINEERSKIADRFQIFKDNHPLYDKIISKAIDFLPSPFDKIAQFIYATFEGSEEEKCEQITEYFNDIKMRGEEHYDRLWFKLQDITKEIHDIKDLGNRESTVLQLIVEILTTSSITIKQKLDLLEKEIDLLIKTSKAGGIKPIKNKFELAKCYNVESNRVIEIRDSDLVNTKKWVEKWDWTDRKGKPILLITGDPGTGKSWLAYRLAYELMEDGYRVSRIIGTDIHQILIDSFEEESKNFSDIEKFVFVLDDSGISIGEINTPLTPDDIYNIIKTMTDQQQTFSGPLVLSMREETWNHIISGTKGRKGFMKSKIRELVEIKELHPLTEYETGKIIYSFYESVGDNIPYYQNLKVKQIAKKGIIKKSKGNPVIIRLFFVQMHHQSRGESYEITSLDTMQIISNATFYVSKQLFDYYINITDDKEKFSNALAFLYFIVKIGSLSVGHLTRIKEEVNQNYFTDQLWEYLLSLNDKRAFPLFNIDDLGIMLPFHDTVSHAIQQLVEHPEELESNTPADQEEIRACIRKIEDIDTDSSIREKSEKEFLKQYKYLIVKALDYYFDKRLNREINRRANISDETAYNFFSLFIEFLRAKDKFIFDSRIINKYTYLFRSTFKKCNIISGEMEININKQLYSIFESLDWVESPPSELKQYYLDLLRSKSDDIKGTMWENASDLLEEHIVTHNELRGVKKHFFELLKTSDYDLREKAYENLSELISENIISREDNRIFLDLLQSPIESIRSDAWSTVSDSIEDGIIKPEDLNNIKDYFLDLLKSSDDDIIENAWDDLSSLMEKDIISIEDYLNLFNNSDEKVRSDAWKKLSTLIRRKLIQIQEVKHLKDYFLDLLKSSDDDIRADAWSNFLFLIQNELLKPDDLHNIKDYFLDLLKSSDEKAREKAWDNVNDLIQYGLLKPEEYVDFLQFINKMTDIDRNNSQAWYTKGLILDRIKNYEESIESYSKAIDIDPYNTDLWQNKGLALAKLGIYKEAIECFDKALEIDAKNIALWNNKGASLNMSGNYKEAIECFDKALDMNPKYYFSLNNKGDALSNLGKYEEAIECYDSALQINPNYLNSWHNKGYVLNELAKYEEAIECYDRVIEIEPENATAWNNKAYSLNRLGKYQEALECCDKTIRINSKYANASFNKGDAFSGLRRYQEAIECYDKALSIESNFPLALNNKGDALSNLGKYEEAIECYDRVIEIEPENATAWNNKGYALHILTKFQEAIECYDKALNVESNLPVAWYNRACSKVKQGDIENGIADLKKAIEIGGNRYINLAKEDQDFKTMRNDERFNTLLII